MAALKARIEILKNELYVLSLEPTDRDSLATDGIARANTGSHGGQPNGHGAYEAVCG